jgi:hypothetical protein
MAYNIRYVSFGEEKKQPKDTQLRNKITASLLVLVLLIGAMTIKHGGLRWVTEYLLPGDPAVTAAALEGMVLDLREGENLYDAVTAFCREIMEHAPTDPD